MSLSVIVVSTDDALVDSDEPLLGSLSANVNVSSSSSAESSVIVTDTSCAVSQLDGVNVSVPLAAV